MQMCVVRFNFVKAAGGGGGGGGGEGCAIDPIKVLTSFYVLLCILQFTEHLSRANG